MTRATSPTKELVPEPDGLAGPSFVGTGNEPLVPGGQIGAYRLLRILGQGGMGVVYLAERRDGQFEQRVALKLLPNWARAADRGRFLRERQFLARMEHPNIARLLDGGLTPNGTPYFALEYVDGEVLGQYALHRNLGLRARIELFLKVCHAVQYAHQHLVIHRDLKPSNILVDASGEPKLLDFGIAKAIDVSSETTAAETEQGLHQERTHTVTRIMTPAYAAPEQILGQPVSTLTDVYSLGVILHELLLGERPHPWQEGVLPEAQIVQDEVPLPSSRQSLVATVPAISLRGDLDLILLTALRREPARRYASAEALTKDLRAYLDARPIAARADRWSYRLRKLLSRHRVASAAVAAVLATLLAAVVLSLSLADRAQREAARAEAVKDFLLGVFESSDPNQRGAPNVSARELLDAARLRVHSHGSESDEIRAALALSMATAYNRIGLFDSALRLDEVMPDSAEALLERAIAERGLGRLQEAQQSIEGALRAADGGSNLGLRIEREWVALAVERGDLAAARTRLERILPKANKPELRVALMLDLARIHGKSDRPNEAQLTVYQALKAARQELGELHTATAEALSEQATIFDAAGEREAAGEHYKKAIDTLTALLGERHLKVLQARDAYGFFLQRSGSADAAEREFTAALGIAEASYGPRHRVVAQLKLSLSTLAARRGQLPEAESLIRTALDIQREVYGEHSLEALEAMNILATILGHAERYDEASALLAQSLSIAERLPPIERTRKLSSIEHKAANMLRQQGRCREARPMFLRVIEREARPDSAFSLESSHARLSDCELILGQHERALAHAVEAYAIAQSSKGLPAHRHSTLMAYARALAANNERPHARTLALEALQGSKQQLGEESPAYREAQALWQQLKDDGAP